jgi:hypothetical protein
MLLKHQVVIAILAIGRTKSIARLRPRMAIFDRIQRLGNGPNSGFRVPKFLNELMDQ